jgi:hypothetical protein
MTKDLAVIDKVNGTALEVYHDRDEVRELAQRLLSLHPAASEVGQEGMFAIAQLALMINASPLPGVNEIHVWKSGQKVQFQLGINYFRRMADEGGGVLWQTKPRQMTDRERKEYGVINTQLAAICSAIRVDDMEYWLKKGFTANQVFDMKAAVGIATAGQNEGKHGRPPVWTALKRAEVDLYKQLFPTMMQNVAKAQSQTPEIVVETDPGPAWDGLEDHDAEFDLGAANDYLFAPDGAAEEPETAVEGDYEEIEPPAETTEPERHALADIRAELESKIEGGKITLGEVYDAAVTTGFYNSWKHAYQAAVNKDTGFDFKGAKAHRNQAVTGKGGLMFFDWLIDRKKVETGSTDEEE